MAAHDFGRITQAIEDYLKTIYELTREKEVTSTSEIAEKLSISPASVTSMLKRLADFRPSLVDYQKSRGVQLTEEGERSALRKIRQHRLIELFLVEVLGYSWDEIHEEAEVLEHVVSPKLEDHLAKILGDPKFDPHGDPIPNKELNFPETNSIPLIKMEPKKRAIVRRVRSSDSGLLKYLGEIGIKPKSVIKMLSIIPFDHTIHIMLEGEMEERVIGEEIGSLVWVEVLEK